MKAQSVWIPRMSVSRVVVLVVGFGLWALGFGLWALGCGIWDWGFGVWALVFKLRVVGCVDSICHY